jgi:hypothetical protein
VGECAHRCRKPLKRLRLDGEGLGILRTGISEELRDAARKCFTDSRYDEAFRLSQFKTRSLPSTPLSPPPDGAAAPTPASLRPASRGFDLGLPPGRVAAFLLVLALPILAWMLPTPNIPRVLLGGENVTEISPFLESGYAVPIGGRLEFIGRLGPAWNYLEPHQRLRVTAEIGHRLEDRNFLQILLEDEFGRVHARYRNGPELEEVERLGTPPRLSRR